MTDMPIEAEGEIWPDIEEISDRFVRLSILPAPRPPLVVLEQPSDIGLNLISRRRKVIMAFKVGRG